jgi:hypothetical protein
VFFLIGSFFVIAKARLAQMQQDPEVSIKFRRLRRAMSRQA